MRRFRKFLRLPTAERILLLKALLLVAAVRTATWVLPFGVVRRALDRVAQRALDGVTAARKLAGHQPVERVAWAVEAAGRRIPGGGNCLVQALSAEVLLRRHGHPALTRIGVKKSATGKLEAHAWVESGGDIVIGGAEAIGAFTPLPALGEANR